VSQSEGGARAEFFSVENPSGIHVIAEVADQIAGYIRLYDRLGYEREGGLRDSARALARSIVPVIVRQPGGPRAAGIPRG
jgi:hypothetical protein